MFSASNWTQTKSTPLKLSVWWKNSHTRRIPHKITEKYTETERPWTLNAIFHPTIKIIIVQWILLFRSAYNSQLIEMDLTVFHWKRAKVCVWLIVLIKILRKWLMKKWDSELGSIYLAACSPVQTLMSVSLVWLSFSVYLSGAYSLSPQLLSVSLSTFALFLALHRRAISPFDNTELD